MSRKSDRELGMGRRIQRRDFLQGGLIGAGAALTGGLSPALAQAAEAERAAQDQPGYYPPERLGLRGSHPGSFEAAHALRDGDFWDHTSRISDTGEAYDLVVVGGGISGLSAAHFFRQSAPAGARVLILDNHDDFGGHAKRNEFHVGGRMQLLNGGTWAIESPTPFAPPADGLMKTLGIHPTELSKACNDPSVYGDLRLKPSVFFDKETFGVDQLVVGLGRSAAPGRLEALLAQAPLSDAVRRDIMRIETGAEDPLPGLSSDEKKDRLSRMSHQDYLLNLLKADPGVIAYYRHQTDGLWGCGIDAVSAIDAWGSGLAGYQGLKLGPGATARMGYTPAGFVATGGSPTFHYPDGNASIARLLVRDLIPAAMPGSDAEDIVTARADYSQLDRPGAPVRLRLNSIVVRARNIGGVQASRGVEIAYSRAGKVWRVKAKHCVLASWNMMIPYLCPELPEPQKEALHKLIKTPLVYSSVALRDWTAFAKLGTEHVYAPGGYHSSFSLNPTVTIGGYASPRTPQEPVLVRMERTPAMPGLNERDQHRVGRAELLATPFETFERNIRDQLGRTLGAGGFDPARDIEAIIVNRWPHGYAPEYNALIDGDTPPDQMPNLIGRARFGRIAIANADSGMGAYTDVAMNQAHRAVHELLGDG
ncbi:MAG: NAD(P)-binding protein [Caulobacteraceae bacterium]|nr:NAD(P)-binding protein [Caulobacteraceae bacterium]